MSKVIERIKKQVKDVEFIEIDGSYLGHKIVVITKDSIENIKKEHSEECKLLVEYSKFILDVSNVDTIVHNWAKAKIWTGVKCLSVSKNTYKISEAMKILSNHNQKDIYHPKNSMELLKFAISLKQDKARAITLGGEDTSLKFLFVWSKSSEYYNKSGVNNSSRQYLLKLLEGAFHAMGTQYEKVQLTSSSRTQEDQAEIMSNMLDQNQNGIRKIIDVYGDTKLTGPFVKQIQSLYDNGKLIDITNPYDSEFKELCIQFANNSSDENLDSVYLEYKQSKDLCEKLLLEIMKKGWCKPSYHVGGQAFDISPKNRTTMTLKCMRSSGVMERSNYIHFTIL